MDGATTLFDLLPIGAYRSSLEGKQLRANAALARLNGYDSESLMLAAVNDIASECYVLSTRRAEFQRLIERDGMVVDFVSEIYRHRTRERIWVRENAHLVRDADGRALCYEGTVEDIDRTHRAEQALQASERRFRAFTERSQQLTLVCDAQAVVSYASPAALWVFGLQPHDLLQSNLFDRVHPDDLAFMRSELATVLAGGRRDQGETVCRARHADGSWRHVSMLANNCLADPAVAGLVVNVRDVSDRKRAEAALLALNAELEQRVQRRTRELVQARDEAVAANRAKSQFLSRMSHELRTPMHAILGFGQLLADEPALAAAPPARAHVRQILGAGECLLGLIDGLLDLARIDADGASPRDAPAPPAPCRGTVLYIEDNAVNQLLMEAVLQQRTQLHMLRADLPEAGLEMARKQRPDLILLDIQLPGIDGYEVLRRLRHDAATRAIPVVAVSANALRSDIERGLAAGFTDYLTKPIDQTLLVATLQRLLPQQR